MNSLNFLKCLNVTSIYSCFFWKSNRQKVLQIFKTEIFTSSSRNLSTFSQLFDGFDKNVTETLQQRKFLKPVEDAQGKFGYDRGILSKEIISNWRSEWWRYVILGNKFVINVALEEFIEAVKEDEDIWEKLIIKHLMKSIQKQTPKLPLCVAANVVSHPKEKYQNDLLLLAILVEKRHEKLDFDSWNSNSIRWMKKYMQKPAKIVTKSVENSDTNSHKKNDIVYNYNNSLLLLQESTLLSSDFLRTMQNWNEVETTLKTQPSMIVIKHNLQNLLAATLADGYHTISFPNYFNRQLRIHPYLAPVKAAVYIKGESNDQLKELSKELCSLIRSMNATCWNANELNLNYSDADESAVVHGIVISQETLETGLLHIRNRDTSLKVEAHITELEEKLFKYLEPT